MYIITTIGTPANQLMAWKSETPLFTAPSPLKVQCSCPSSQDQLTSVLSSKDNTLWVFKHAAVALGSVIDLMASAALQCSRQAHLAQDMAVRKQEIAQDKVVHRQQEQNVPFEADRVEHNIKKLSTSQVVALVHKALGSVKGLRHAASLFPAAVMPLPSLAYCVGCNKEYDPQFTDEHICQMDHPHQMVSTKWDGSKIRSDHRRKCDCLFNGHNKSNCNNEWYFEGEHASDEDAVAAEGWDDDAKWLFQCVHFRAQGLLFGALKGVS